MSKHGIMPPKNMSIFLLAMLTIAVFANLSCKQEKTQKTEQTKLPSLTIAQGVDLSKLSDNVRRSITEADADFLAVLSGKPPIYAKFDEKAPLPADGGTTYYKGNGYVLTIVKTLMQLGNREVFGFNYGPSIVFNNDILSGNSDNVLYIRFYTQEELKKLLK